MPKNNHHPHLGYYVHQSRGKYFTILIGSMAISSALVFGLTISINSAQPIKVTTVIPSPTPTPSPTINGGTSGEAALTDSQLKTEVLKVGRKVYWSGILTGANYTFINLETGQSYIRYLPDGQGLEDATLNYRVIATYSAANAYDSLVAAGKTEGSVVITSQEGIAIYYVKARPKNVFMAFQNLDYQIEIFDPTPGISLKLASTPGAIRPVS